MRCGVRKHTAKCHPKIASAYDVYQPTLNLEFPGALKWLLQGAPKLGWTGWEEGGSLAGQETSQK